MSTDRKRPAPRRPVQKHRMADIRRAPRRETILTKGLQVAEVGDNAVLEETLRQMIPDEKLPEFNSGTPDAKPRKPRPLPNRVPKGTPNFRDGLLEELDLVRDQLLHAEADQTIYPAKLDSWDRDHKIKIDDQNSGAIGGNAEPPSRRGKTRKKIGGILELTGKAEAIAPNAAGTIHNRTVANIKENKMAADELVERLHKRELEIMKMLEIDY